MDKPNPQAYAEIWTALSAEAHASLARVLAHAQTVRQWAIQAEQLTEPERAELLAHLTALEETTNRLNTLTAPDSEPEP